MSNQTIVPTFCLFKVDHDRLVTEYRSGMWNSFVMPKIKVDSYSKIGEQGITNQIHGSSPDNDSFSYTSRSGEEIVFITTNNTKYKTYHIEGQGTATRCQGECDWCRLDCMEGESMGGIPISVTTEYYPTVPGKVEMKMCFWTVGNLCDFRCAYAHLMSISRGKTRFNSNNNSETWLKIMYSLAYPDGPTLEPAPHPSHLKENGGTITREQFKLHRFRFVQTNAYVTKPGKVICQRVTRM